MSYIIGSAKSVCCREHTQHSPLFSFGQSTYLASMYKYGEEGGVITIQLPLGGAY